MLAFEASASFAARRTSVHHYLKLSHVQEHAARKWAQYFGNNLEMARKFVAEFERRKGTLSLRAQSVGATQDLNLGAFGKKNPSDKFLSVGRLNAGAQSQPRTELPNGARAQARAQWAALGFSGTAVSRIMNKDYSPIREIRMLAKPSQRTSQAYLHFEPSFKFSGKVYSGLERYPTPILGPASFLAAEQKTGQVDGWKSEKGNVRFETHPEFGPVAVKKVNRPIETQNAQLASRLGIGPKVFEAPPGKIVMERVNGDTLESIMHEAGFKTTEESGRIDAQFGDVTLGRKVQALRYSNPQFAERLARIHEQVVNYKRKGQSNGLQISDLNSSNIMVNSEGRVVLLDFEF